MSRLTAPLDLIPRQLGRRPKHLRAPNLHNTWIVAKVPFDELTLDKIPEENSLAFYVSIQLDIINGLYTLSFTLYVLYFKKGVTIIINKNLTNCVTNLL